MVVKLKRKFVWHFHPDTDDLSYVLKGHPSIQLRGGNVHLGPGDLYAVPRGVQHRPLAEEEVHLLLIEPTDTPSIGDVRTAALKEVI